MRNFDVKTCWKDRSRESQLMLAQSTLETTRLMRPFSVADAVLFQGAAAAHEVADIMISIFNKARGLSLSLTTVFWLFLVLNIIF